MTDSLQKIKNTKQAVNFAANLRSHHPEMTWLEITKQTVKNNHALYRIEQDDIKFVSAQLNKDVLTVYPELRKNKPKKKKRKYTKRKAKKEVALHTHGAKDTAITVPTHDILATISKLKAKGVDADTILVTVEALYGN